MLMLDSNMALAIVVDGRAAAVGEFTSGYEPTSVIDGLAGLDGSIVD